MSDPITTAEETLGRYDNLTNANGYGAGDHRRLAAALRSLIEHAKARDAARDEVQEKIAYLRRNCMHLPEQELRQKISAVDSAEWRLGYYWNALVAEHRDRATRAEYAQREAESERDGLQGAYDEMRTEYADYRNAMRGAIAKVVDSTHRGNIATPPWVEEAIAELRTVRILKGENK